MKLWFRIEPENYSANGTVDGKSKGAWRFALTETNIQVIKTVECGVMEGETERGRRARDVREGAESGLLLAHTK